MAHLYFFKFHQVFYCDMIYFLKISQKDTAYVLHKMVTVMENSVVMSVKLGKAYP